MKNSGARSSVIVGLGAVALMLTGIACGSGNDTTTGQGGAGGGSATGGAGGAPKAAVLSYTFDTAGATEGFAIQKYVDGMNLNLGALAADAGVPDGGSYPTLVQMAGVGQGTPPSGALAVTADFTNYLQYVEITLALSPAKDLAGTTIHASVNVDKSFYGGAFIYAKSGQQYVYANSTGTPLANGTFTQLAFSLDTAVAATQGQTFDPTLIEEIGIHIYADAMPDGGVFASGPYTFYIDNVIAK